MNYAIPKNEIRLFPHYSLKFLFVCMLFTAMLCWIIVQDMRADRVRDLLSRRAQVDYHHRSLGEVVIYKGRPTEMYHASQCEADMLAVERTDLVILDLTVDEIEFLKRFMSE